MDQVRQMRERERRGISAVYVGVVDEGDAEEVCRGRYQLVSFSPEALLTDEVWHDMLLSIVPLENLVEFVLDEAHCVK